MKFLKTIAAMFVGKRYAQTAPTKRSFPFTPKSALKMEVGDYWPVQREDGNFGFFVFLGRWAHLRQAFTTAILDHVQSSPDLQTDGAVLRLREVGHLHVKTFQATGSQIIGNISERLDHAEVRRELKRQKTTSRVWGFEIPPIKVNEIDVQ